MPNLKTDYVLEIYEPEQKDCVAAVFHSDTPFMSFNKGDFIHGGTLYEMQNPKSVEIESIQHILWQIDGSHQTHKICIHTKLLK